MTLSVQTSSLHRIERKVLSRERLSSEEGLLLLKDIPLLDLGGWAQQIRQQKLPGNQVTYVIDSNPNYTNICDTDCTFCAFYRKPKAADAYQLTHEQVLEKVSKATAKGATTILLQGGHNVALPLDYYTGMVRAIVERFPSVTPHCFTASEIQTMARVSGLSIRDVLCQLKDAGQRTLPGGGAEILSTSVRRKISPKKGGPEAWLEVHREAHNLGFYSTATMMYGHVETPEDIVEHWDNIRHLQDESLEKTEGGFTAFVPWSYKPNNTALARKVQRTAGPMEYLRIISASRIYLDNFTHIQASWFSEGKKTGQVALHFGADDFGGTLFEENVHAAADFVNKTSAEEIVDLIRQSGFIPVQRTTMYDLLKVHGS